MLTKYAGPCFDCGIHVPNEGPNQGHAVKVGGAWKRFCLNCSPDKSKPVQAPQSDERTLTADGRILMPFSKDALPLLRSLPGAFWDASANPKCWRVSIAPADRFRLLEVADALKLDVAPTLREIVKTEQAHKAGKAGLYPFQVEGVNWLATEGANKRLLADDMGLGKTVQTLVAVPDDMGALCVVPAGVKYNWNDECRKWRPELKVTILSGRGSFRLPEVGEVVVVNFDILPAWLEPVKINADSKPWEVKVEWPNEKMREHAKKIVLIVDEAQRVKNVDALRSKRVKGLSMGCGKSWFLTGTPLENRAADLYGVLEAMGASLMVFGGWKRFCERMNATPKTILKYNPKTRRKESKFIGYEWGTPSPEVPELLRRVMLRRLREVVLPDLPKKTYTNIKVDLPDDLRSEMDDAWDQWGYGLDDSVPMADRELPPFEEFSTLRRKLAESRIPALEELVEEHEEANVPLVVFSSHLAPIHAIGKREGWAIIDGSTKPEARQGIVRDFQAGLLKGVAISTRAGGVGLTLTRAWKAIFVDLDWVPGQNAQAEDRICRIGQLSKTCQIVRMVSDHVLDLHVLALIAWKIDLIQKAVEISLAETIVVPDNDKKLLADTRELLNDAKAAGINVPQSFEDRIAAAAAVIDGVDCEVSEGGWLPIKTYDDIPF
jgi:SNF2 family DNA or RNA helicase